MKWLMAAATVASLAVLGGVSSAQNAPAAGPAAAAPGAPAPGARRGPPPEPALGDGPWDLPSQKGMVHVSVVTKGLERPWGMAWLPNGDMLVTERAGRLRLVQDGKLDPALIGGLPKIYAKGLAGLMDIALHPDYARNHLVYFTYTKEDPNSADESTVALGRARYDPGSHTLTDFQELFVADMWYGHGELPKRCCGQGPATGSYGSRIQFDKSGHLFMTSGDRNYGEMVHQPGNDYGKLFRFNADGSIPKDNPNKPGFRPEVWSTGHRNGEGLFYDADTGKLWESEFGPRGGCEVNLIEKGGDYGWIEVTQGAHYNGEPAKLGTKNVPGKIDPILTWPAPSTNPGNLIIYHANKFPQWKGDLLMGTMSRSLLRASFDSKGNVTGQERFLTELKQRFRDTRVGPDGNLYLLTDEPEGALLKVEPGK